MSNMHLIMIENKMAFLPKERYLKFTEYGYINGFFIYTRYDYQLNMINLLDNDCYSLSTDGKNLLEKILSANPYFYWSCVQLANHQGEKEVSIQYLNFIKNKQFIKTVLLENHKFNINTLYCFSNKKPT